MRTTLAFAICLVAALVLAAITTRFVTSSFVFSVFHNLQIHLAAVAILAGLIALAIDRNLFAVGIIAWAMALLLHGILASDRFSEPLAAPPGQSIRFLSFNVLETNTDNARTIADLVIASGADVVNIMEAPALVSELDHLSTAYPYRIGCGSHTPTCDLMMLSKTPLYDITVASLSDLRQDRFFLATTDHDGKPVHFAAIHLTKPYFDSYPKKELWDASELLSTRKGPVVMSGDFNAATLSPDLQHFLGETGLRTAPDEPATWPVDLGRFGLPIDHVLVRGGLVFRALTRLPQAYGSNHFGLTADLILPDA